MSNRWLPFPIHHGRGTSKYEAASWITGLLAVGVSLQDHVGISKEKRRLETRVLETDLILKRRQLVQTEEAEEAARKEKQRLETLVLETDLAVKKHQLRQMQEAEEAASKEKQSAEKKAVEAVDVEKKPPGVFQ